MTSFNECTIKKINKHLITEKGSPKQIIKKSENKSQVKITKFEYKPKNIDNVKVHMETSLYEQSGHVTQFKLIHGNKESKFYPVLSKSCKCSMIQKYGDDTQEDIINMAISDINH